MPRLDIFFLSKMQSEYYTQKNYESFYYFISLFVLRDGTDFIIW